MSDLEAKAKLLDAAPLCGVALDESGKAVACNKLFVELMGPLYKFANYEFAEAAVELPGKGKDIASRAKLKIALSSVRAGISARERVRNVEMLTLAGDAGLPVKAHFDWFIGPGDAPGELILFGDPCSDDILAQREKDAELIDFFQNAPIALHWLSGTGHVMWANQTELDVLGYTATEYIGQPIMKFCPDEEELVLEIFKTLGSGNVIKDVPVRFRRKDGKIVPLLIDSNVAYKVDDKGEKAFNHTRCFIRDDTGRRVREARVEAMLKETRRSLKVLDAFVSRTLHLVKTPCHVVQTSLQLLASNLQNEHRVTSETRLLLEGSMKQLADVTELISDASDVMRFEQGAVMQTVPVPLPLGVLCHACVDEALAISKPDVTVAFELSAGPSIVSLDAKLLHRALRHLLRNAAEATAGGGRITLRVSHSTENAALWTGQQGGRVRFEVSDTGCGLPKGSSNIFQRYYPGPLDASDGPVSELTIEEARASLEASLSFSAPKTTGLGIGLNLTYCLVRSLGGELRYESQPGDTRFWFLLPMEGAQTHEASSSFSAVAQRPASTGTGSSRASSQRGLNWDSISSSSGSDTSFRASLAGGLASRQLTSNSDDTLSSDSDDAALRSLTLPRHFVDSPASTKSVRASCVANEGLKAIDPPHVLVVEDTEMCATVVRILLGKLGCSSDHAENGAQAVDLLRHAEPGLYSLVIMDLRMPVMDGFEATCAIREELQMTLPVVALTADETFGTRDKCASLGFDDFAPKPLKYDALASLLQKHTGHNIVAAEELQ